TIAPGESPVEFGGVGQANVEHCSTFRNRQSRGACDSLTQLGIGAGAGGRARPAGPAARIVGGGPPDMPLYRRSFRAAKPEANSGNSLSAPLHVPPREEGTAREHGNHSRQSGTCNGSGNAGWVNAGRVNAG